MKNKLRFVKGIRIVRDKSAGNELDIKAKGIAQINMRITPVLTPKEYDQAPEDGIFELDFSLDESVGDITQMEVEVEVVFHIKNVPEWIKGVRINADENSDIELL